MRPDFKSMLIKRCRITESIEPLGVFVSMRLAAMRSRGEQIPFIRNLSARKAHIFELFLVVGAYLVYFFTRGLVFSEYSGIGMENAGRIISFEKALGFFWEPGLQSWVLSNVKGFASVLNWVYIITYWPVIVVTGAALYVVNRPKYYYYRTVVVINLVGALLIFMLFPVTSPFNITQYFVNTIQELGPGLYGGSDMAVFYNAQAAMPSLHFSWTVILGVLFMRTFKGWFRIAGVFYPILTFLAIIITGNHFILDAIVGGILVMASFALMELGFRGGFLRVWRKMNLTWLLLRRKMAQGSLRLGR